MFEILHHRLVKVIEQRRHRARRQLRHRYEFLVEVLAQPLENFIVELLQSRDRAILQTELEKFIELLLERRDVDDEKFGRRQSIKLIEQLLIPIGARIQIIKAFARRDVGACQRDLIARLEHQRDVIVDGVVQSVVG